MLNRYRIISIVHCVSGLLCEYGLIERQLVCWLIDWLTGRWLCDDVITLQHDGNLYIIFVVVTLLLSLYTPHEDRKLSRWSFCYHLTQLSWVRDYWAIKQVQIVLYWKVVSCLFADALSCQCSELCLSVVFPGITARHPGGGWESEFCASPRSSPAGRRSACIWRRHYNYWTGGLGRQTLGITPPVGQRRLHPAETGMVWNKAYWYYWK